MQISILPGEQHGDKKRQTPDFICSKYTYRLDRAVEDPGNRILYYLQDGPGKAVLCERLVNVSEDTNVSGVNHA